MTDPRRSLQDLIDETPDLVDYFFNDTIAPHFRARTSLTAAFIPPEFSNWREEQLAWRNSVVLFDQSHHMPELFIEGPDARRLLEGLAINSFDDFASDRAKQYIVCNPDGYVIGDSVIYHWGDDGYELVSGMAVLDWVAYNAEVGDFDVTITRDDPTPYNPKGRRILYRFQLDGPNASALLDDVVEGGMPEVGFFRTTTVRIDGCDVLLLRHGMAGHKGAEISGPYEEMPRVLDALLRAGVRHGLVRGGTRSYFSSKFESSWNAYPTPAIFTGEQMRGFREWLSADGWEASCMLAGSFRSDSIEDYYSTPWDLGYGHIIKFDHEFVGRAALEKMASAPPRQRVTLVWNAEDVGKIFLSQFGNGPRFKALEFPEATYGFPQADAVRAQTGEQVGVSAHCGYSINEGEMLSIAMVDSDFAHPGMQLILRWGEEGGGSRKAHVEPHVQTDVRVTVAPAPYASAVRSMKRAAIGV